MRRAYQKAVAIPLNNVEHLWKEYDQWENNLNRLTVIKTSIFLFFSLFFHIIHSKLSPFFNCLMIIWVT